jgi:hypothetical protein
MNSFNSTMQKSTDIDMNVSVSICPEHSYQNKPETNDQTWFTEPSLDGGVQN